MTRYKHPLLIDSLERALFPHQESEEEQESFTKEGRKRVDQWLSDLFKRLAPAVEEGKPEP